MKNQLTREEIRRQLTDGEKGKIRLSLVLLPLTVLLLLLSSVVLTAANVYGWVIGLTWLALPGVAVWLVLSYRRKLKIIGNDGYTVKEATFTEFREVYRYYGKRLHLEYEARFDGGKYVLRGASRSFKETNTEGDAFYLVCYERKEKDVILCFNARLYDLTTE